jgi:hypothetical protein
VSVKDYGAFLSDVKAASDSGKVLFIDPSKVSYAVYQVSEWVAEWGGDGGIVACCSQLVKHASFYINIIPRWQANWLSCEGGCMGTSSRLSYQNLHPLIGCRLPRRLMRSQQQGGRLGQQQMRVMAPGQGSGPGQRGQQAMGRHQLVSEDSQLICQVAAVPPPACLPYLFHARPAHSHQHGCMFLVSALQAPLHPASPRSLSLPPLWWQPR